MTKKMVVAARVGGRKSLGQRTQLSRVGLQALEDRVLLASTPFGNVDVLSRSLIAGWAFDQDSGATALNVQINIDGTTTNVRADQDRSDLQSFLGSSNHGFTFTVPTPGPGDHAVSVSLIDPLDGHLTLLKKGTITNPAPIGNLDVSNATTLAGWAFDADAGATPLSVRVDVNGTTLTTVTANQSRPDLAGFGSTNHGFQISGAFAGKIVEIVALDNPTNTPVVIASNNHAAIGSVDILSQTQVAGWTYDPDHKGGSIQVRVDVDGTTGTAVTANAARPDLQAWLGGSNYGFTVSLPTSLSPGTHQVKVFALDPDSLANHAVLISSGTVTNPPPGGNIDVADNAIVAGWALDANAVNNGSIQVELRLDDKAFATVTANGSRADLASLGMGTAHGFQVAMPTLTAGPHRVSLYGADAPSGTMTLIGSKVVNNHLPFGYLDVATTQTISGWAFDPDPNGLTSVRLYIDNVAYDTIVANQNRADLQSAIGSSNHGFTFSTPTLSFGTHTIEVRAIDTFTQETVTLGTKTVVKKAPFGSIDVAQPTLVAGWAFSPDMGAASIDVLFAVDGTVVARTTANGVRADLQGFLGSANHGYSFSFSNLGKGKHTFQIFAVDPSGITASLGTRTVTV